MNALSIIIVAAMAVPFLFCVIVIITGTMHNRRAARKLQRRNHSYFRQ